MNINKKSFGIILKTGKSFAVYLSGFASAVTLFFNNIFTISIDYLVSLYSGMDVILTSGRNKILISVIKLTEKISQTFSAKKISLSISVKEALRAAIVFVQGLSISPEMSLRQRVSTSISNKLPIVATILLANFNTLLTFDYDDLGSLDVMTLGDMDYTVL